MYGKPMDQSQKSERTDHRITDRAVDRRLESSRRRTAAEIDEILEAARVVLARGGWSNLKVSEVLSEARLPTRAFYRDFRGKSELLLALLEQEIENFAAQIQGALARCDTTTDQLSCWIESNIAVGYDDRTRDRARFFAYAAESLAEEFPFEISRIRGLLIDPLRAVIAAGKEDGIFLAARPDPDAIDIWLMTSTLMRDPMAGGLGEAYTSTLEDRIQLVLDFALRALHAEVRTPQAKQPDVASYSNN
jgi:AcrR family transcriptional regulator